jgi:hypothetical protein
MGAASQCLTLCACAAHLGMRRSAISPLRAIRGVTVTIRFSRQIGHPAAVLVRRPSTQCRDGLPLDGRERCGPLGQSRRIEIR